MKKVRRLPCKNDEKAADKGVFQEYLLSARVSQYSTKACLDNGKMYCLETPLCYCYNHRKEMKSESYVINPSGED